MIILIDFYVNQDFFKLYYKILVFYNRHQEFHCRQILFLSDFFILF